MASFRSDGFLIEVKIREVSILDADFYMQLRCGWLIRGSVDREGCTQYTKWRSNTRNGKIGWKKSMSNHIPIESPEVILVLYQKVGEQPHALCIEQIDCSKCVISAGVKRKFSIDLKLQEGRRGTMTGWIKAVEDLQDNINDVFASRSRSYGLGTLMSKQRRGQEMSYTDTYSNNYLSTTASESVDLSIALECEIPTKYWPLMNTKMVHKMILDKHPEILNEPDGALRFLLEIPDEKYCFQIPAHRQKPANYEDVFLELGLLRSEARKDTNDTEWKLEPRVVDFLALKETIQALIGDYD